MTQPSRAPAVTGEWECTECGYLETGAAMQRPAKCPECGAPAEAFDFLAEDEEEWSDLDEDEEDDLGLEDDDIDEDYDFDDDLDDDADDADEDDEEF